MQDRTMPTTAVAPGIGPPVGRRRRGSAALAALVVGALLTGCAGDPSESESAPEDSDQAESPGSGAEGPGEGSGEQSGGDASDDASATDPEAGPSEEGDPDEEQARPDWPASSSTGLQPVETITAGDISPKSVVSSDHGLIITNNMMYQHNITLYDARTHEVVQTLEDTVQPAEFGLEGYPDTVAGSPVEATWTADGQHAYVSNYQLNDGAHRDLGASADDSCTAGDAIRPSFVYRYSVVEQDWDQVIEVGRVPKFLTLTPDDSRLLVSNWCDASMSVVDTASGEEIEQIGLNSMPRGIVAMLDNTTVYATAMFADEVYAVDLDQGTADVVLRTGSRPRHLVRDAAGEDIYLTVSGADAVLRLDPESGEVVDRAVTGDEPRSMAISADGSALHVVNYHEDTVSKFDAESMEEIVRRPTGHHPVGITYDVVTGSVLVANYSGSLSVYDDTGGAPGSLAAD
ncbi:YncE family protein [Nesterenkonia sp. F]|uniref:YncE family protein n=1 Tax=Nesterenkonia sp. F TaxID=795955 RepID=UPI000255D1B4|nr:YncE family protein [Nesterenkonia sp. F]